MGQKVSYNHACWSDVKFSSNRFVVRAKSSYFVYLSEFAFLESCLLVLDPSSQTS